MGPQQLSVEGAGGFSSTRCRWTEWTLGVRSPSRHRVTDPFLPIYQSGNHESLISSFGRTRDLLPGTLHPQPPGSYLSSILYLGSDWDVGTSTDLGSSTTPWSFFFSLDVRTYILRSLGTRFEPWLPHYNDREGVLVLPEMSLDLILLYHRRRLVVSRVVSQPTGCRHQESRKGLKRGTPLDLSGRQRRPDVIQGSLGPVKY